MNEHRSSTSIAPLVVNVALILVSFAFDYPRHALERAARRLLMLRP